MREVEGIERLRRIAREVLDSHRDPSREHFKDYLKGRNLSAAERDIVRYEMDNLMNEIVSTTLDEKREEE